MLRRFVIGVLTTGSMLALGAQTATAQSNVEVNAGIQFDFLSPGARSLALGGAFTALADDATTAYTNPAGLREISRKEVSFEARIRSFSTPFTLRGRAFGNPTGNGVDTVAGLVDGTSDETVFSPSFLSFVYPSGKWAIAAYAHELAHFKTNITTEGAFIETTPVQTTRLLPVKGSLDLKVRDYGVSGSYTLNDKASVGAGVVVYHFTADSVTQRFLTPSIFAPANYSDANLSSVQTQDGSGNAVGLNAGLHFKPSNTVNIGLVYTRRASFDERVTHVVATTGVPVVDDTARFHIPDVFSAGIMFRAVPAFRVAVDYTHVRYSQMTEDFVDVFPSDSRAEDYSVDDANEIHVGGEYLISSSKAPVTLRGGFWFDPSHSLVYSGSTAQFQVLFRERDSNMHYSGGVGVGLKQFELNAGFDISKLVKSTSISAVVRF
jgi:long-subunit fatty acid transport protein